jgi:hypothetical protein
MKFFILVLLVATGILANPTGFPLTGADDFKILARSGKIVDKTLLIKDLIEHNNLVTLITRPRRWGKSISISMLWRFFALERNPVAANESKQLFESLKIRHAEVHLPGTGQKVNVFDHFQGTCPSIYLSLKDVRGDNIEQMTTKLKQAVSLEFRRHDYLAVSLEEKSKQDSLPEYIRDEAKSYLDKFKRLALDDGKQASSDDLEGSLQFLSKLLYEFHKGEKVCVFVDEYDAPLHKAFAHGYLEKGTDLIRNMFSPVLKSNSELARAILTGILRLAKANLFSGVNNLVEDSVFSTSYAAHYGFTDTDLDELFAAFNIQMGNRELFKASYNGYRFYSGNDESSLVKAYNPWSVSGYLKNKGQLDNYWIGTGGTELLDGPVVHPANQDALAALRNDETIRIKIPKDITFVGLANNQSDTLWPLLVHTGYLTLAKAPIFHMESNEYEVDLKIPNIEVRSAYQDFHNKWLQHNNLPRGSIIQHLNNLISAIRDKNTKKVSAWISEEKRSGNPIDFKIQEWSINPLQLAALSGNIEIFNLIREQYPELENIKDSEGLSIGDYAFLGNSSSILFQDRSLLKDPNTWAENLCVTEFTRDCIISAISGSTVPLIWQQLKSLYSDAGLNKKDGLISVVVGASIPILAKKFLSRYMDDFYSKTCGSFERYDKFIKDPSSPSLAQFGEFILRKPDSYVSLSGCQSSDTLISKFDRSVTNVKYSMTTPLTFSLCQRPTYSGIGPAPQCPVGAQCDLAVNN